MECELRLKVAILCFNRIHNHTLNCFQDTDSSIAIATPQSGKERKTLVLEQFQYFVCY